MDTYKELLKELNINKSLIPALEEIWCGWVDWRLDIAPSKISKIIDNVLDEREDTILKHRFTLNGFEHKTLKELGKQFNISPAMVRIVNMWALRKVRWGVLYLLASNKIPTSKEVNRETMRLNKRLWLLTQGKDLSD